MIGLNKKNTYRKKNSFMNDFTKDFAQALFNPDKINDLLRKELQQAVNNLLEAELTAFLGYDPYA
ncbi:transposase for insertion sequence element, partial [Lactobacillus crispatus SJ-3C-US]